MVIGGGTSARAENLRTLEQVRQYITALELIYAEDGKYPITSELVCLGDYRDNTCWKGGTEVPESEVVNERLAHYLPLLPAGKMISGEGEGFEGYVYRSIDEGVKYEIQYVLEGRNAGCGLGDVLSVLVVESAEHNHILCSVVR